MCDDLEIRNELIDLVNDIRWDLMYWDFKSAKRKTHKLLAALTTITQLERKRK